MRRDDRQIWNRVARTVDPMEAGRRERRVPVADPRMRRPGAQPLPDRDAPSPLSAPAAKGPIVAQARERAGGGAAAPPPPIKERDAEEKRLLHALEEWWNAGAKPTDRRAPALSAGLRPLGHAPAPKGGMDGPGEIDRSTTRKIARRRLPLEGRIDLHGMDQETAHAALLSFLHRARAEGLRHVIVITGKGRAPREGVLRRAVPRWLATEPFRGLVSGTREAARHDGGAGALYLKIKRPR